MGSLENKGLWLVLATAVISGISVFINKFGVAGINPDIFTFSKNILVALFLLSILLAFTNLKELRKLSKKQWFQLSAIGLIGGSIPFILFFRGLKLVSAASIGSFIHKAMFLFVAILAIIYLKEKLNWKFFAAAVLLLVGNGLLLRVYYFKSFGLGEALVLAATLFWAAETIISKKVLKEMSGTTVAFGRMFFGSIFILAFLFATGEYRLLAGINASQISWILITSVFLLAYVLTWYNGLKHVSATLATQILLIGAPITSLLGFASGSPITLLECLGIVAIFAAVVFICKDFLHPTNSNASTKST